tara:strand:- start:17 stop:163 length:147 start_codon:yes stop_codon:yes gene_type:complete
VFELSDLMNESSFDLVKAYEFINGGIFGKSWYCASSKVKKWWKQIHWK